MAKRKALGRGLGAFFPDTDIDGDSADAVSRSISAPVSNEPADMVNTVIEVPVGNIRPNPHQPRKHFDEIRLQELSASIRQHGLIQPITVRHLGSHRFELISGERRWRATMMAGIDRIPAYVREVNDNDSIALALIENLQREELNPIEVGQGYQRLIDECEYTQEQVATRIGKNRSTVTNTLRLLNLPAVVQAALRDGKISMGHARALVSVEDADAQEKLLLKAIEEDYSVRQIEEAVRHLAGASRKKRKTLSPKDQLDIEFQEISNRLRKKLSTKVQIRRKGDGGEIRIEYYSADELERLISHLDRS